MTARGAGEGQGQKRLVRWVYLNILLLSLTGLLSLTYPVRELSRRAGDLYFRLRPPLPASRKTALVLIDDSSLQRYGAWPWPRSLLAELVGAVSAQHPRALGIDILLSEPTTVQNDQALAEAIKSAGNVVLASKVATGLGSRVWLNPLPIFARNAAAVGHVQALLGPDDICRSVPLAEMTTEGPRFALAVDVARVAEGNLPGTLPEALQAGAASRERTGVERLHSSFLLIDFHSQINPEESPPPFDWVSAAALLQGRGGKVLRNKVVLIGFGATEITDRFAVPVSSRMLMPGVEIQANLVDGLLAGRNLRPLGSGVELGLLGLLSMLLTWLLLRRPGWQGMLASSILVLGAYGLGYVLLAYDGRLISFGPFLCVGIMALPIVQVENLLAMDRSLTRSLRRLQSALQGTHPGSVAGLRSALRGSAVKASGADLHWKVAAVSEMEEELGALYTFSQTLLTNIQEGLAVFAPEGNLVFQNSGWQEFLRKAGCQPQARLKEIIALLQQPRLQELETALSEPGARLETELLNDKGLWLVQAVRLRPEPHAKSGGLMLITTDLSARLERDLARAEALGFVTHELRTPLVSIQGYAEFLMRYPEAAGSGEAAETIFRESNRLVALINAYLDVMRLESGARALRREAVDLETAFAHLSAVIKPLAESAEVTVKVDGVEPWPQFQGDSDLIAGALLNLLSNAVKYSPRGGEVQMRVWEEPDQVIIEVSNAGPVIPQQEIPRLFEPYFRRGEHEHGVRGWGLGLAFVKRVAEGHGGRVEASSDATVGTRFRLVFPNLRP